MMMNRNSSDRRLSVAPMMDWTDRHCRFFHRILAPHAWLYSEMVTTNALKFGPRARLLQFNTPHEHPVALQLGGSEPDALAESAIMGADAGYDEINLNCGCPSDRVQKGRFGACLMAEPELVTTCITAMQKAVSIPVTVKCRIGIDDMDEEQALFNFVSAIRDVGCTIFIVHARKAWLKGLSPKENREVPPLNYDLVARLKATYPDLTIIVNGGIDSEAATLEHLKTCDGVMLGRAAYHTPALLQQLSTSCHGTTPISLPDITSRMADYAAQQAMDYGTPLTAITKHMVGLTNGMAGARRWRQILTVDARLADNPHTLFKAACDAVC